MDTPLSASATRRRCVLGAVCLAALSLPMTFSGGAVATPTMGADLGGDPLAMSWITNAFMLTFGCLLMAAGTLADRFGRKKLFAYGIGSFAITSFCLSFAPTIAVVDLLRGAQGIGAAAALSGGTAALAQEYDGAARTRAFSLLGTTFGIGLAFGPVIAGWLIAHAGWRAIFAVGTLTGALSLVFGLAWMQESKNPNAQTLDTAGTLAFTAALSCFTCGLIEAPSLGWGSPMTAALLSAFVACAVAFVLIERHVPQPMLDLSLFAYPRFIGVQVLPIATCYCYIVLLVLLPLRFIGVDGLDALQAGVMMFALSAPMLVVPLLAGKLTRWASAGSICGMGLLIAAAGVFALGWALQGQKPGAALLPMLAIGVGTGLPWGLMDGLSVSVVPKERAGMAAGIFSTTRVAGEGVALVCVTALLVAMIHHSLLAVLPGATPATLTAVATRLASGDIGAASTLVPSIRPDALRAIYDAAFGHLLHALALVTVLCAVASFVFLRRSDTVEPLAVVHADDAISARMASTLATALPSAASTSDDR